MIPLIRKVQSKDLYRDKKLIRSFRLGGGGEDMGIVVTVNR
jgi:hypothetical protein